jgi:hypothetical protein
MVKVPGAALFSGLPLTTHLFRGIIGARKAMAGSMNPYRETI